VPAKHDGDSQLLVQVQQPGFLIQRRNRTERLDLANHRRDGGVKLFL
jgi:hypothetical protein